MLNSAESVRLDRRLAYLVFRLSLGINIFVHGAGRIFGPGASAFAAKTGAGFANVPLPHGLVYAFLITVPYAEFILGILITLGLITRWALTLGGLLIATLIFGTALLSDWPTVGIQMIYAIVYYLLLMNRSDNSFSLEALLERKHDKTS